MYHPYTQPAPVSAATVLRMLAQEAYALQVKLERLDIETDETRLALAAVTAAQERLTEAADREGRRWAAEAQARAEAAYHRAEQRGRRRAA